MSVALLVRLKSPATLVDIEVASSAALRELLNLEHGLQVSATFDESDRIGAKSDGLLKDGSKRVVCSPLKQEEQARITHLTIPVRVPTIDDSYSFVDQNYASVEWHFKKTPLCWALVAAVAAGLAMKQESEIEDNAGFFTRSNVQTPSEFCRTLRLQTPQEDAELAAVALYAKMPKSAEIAEWLPAVDHAIGRFTPRWRAAALHRSPIGLSRTAVGFSRHTPAF